MWLWSPSKSSMSSLSRKIIIVKPCWQVNWQRSDSAIKGKCSLQYNYDIIFGYQTHRQKIINNNFFITEYGFRVEYVWVSSGRTQDGYRSTTERIARGQEKILPSKEKGTPSQVRIFFEVWIVSNSLMKLFYCVVALEHCNGCESMQYTCRWLWITIVSCREQDRMLAQNLGPPIVPLSKADMPRFTGGGFNLKQTQKAVAWFMYNSCQDLYRDRNNNKQLKTIIHVHEK